MSQVNELSDEINQDTNSTEINTSLSEIGLSQENETKLAELSNQIDGEKITVYYHGSEGFRELLSAEVSLTNEPLSNDQSALIYELSLDLVDSFYGRWERNEGAQGHFDLCLSTGKICLTHTELATDSDGYDCSKTAEQEPLNHYFSRPKP